MLDGQRANTLSTREKQWNAFGESVRNVSLRQTKRGLSPKTESESRESVFYCSTVIFSETPALNVLWCQSFSVQGAAMMSFYFRSPWQLGSAVTKQGELREAETPSDRNRADRDYMLHYKNDNNRAEAAVEFRWLSVGLLNALFSLRKALRMEGASGWG